MADLDLEKLVATIEQSLEGKGPGEVDAPLQRKAVEAKYAQAWPEIMKQMQSAAVARGGGLDVGGYQTSLGKARTGFETEKLGALADVNKFLASLSTQRVGQGMQAGLGYQGQVQQAGQFKEQMGFEREKLDVKRAYLEEQRKAARKASRDWWKPFLGSLAGMAVGGFTGGLGSGLVSGLVNKTPALSPLHAPGY
jgi:hypothetical protein